MVVFAYVNETHIERQKKKKKISSTYNLQKQTRDYAIYFYIVANLVKWFNNLLIMLSYTDICYIGGCIGIGINLIQQRNNIYSRKEDTILKKIYTIHRISMQTIKMNCLVHFPNNIQLSISFINNFIFKQKDKFSIDIVDLK